MGADVVSIGELQKVLKLGFKPNKIVFSGVGKTLSELDFAIKKKILLINVESESEWTRAMIIRMTKAISHQYLTEDSKNVSRLSGKLAAATDAFRKNDEVLR